MSKGAMGINLSAELPILAKLLKMWPALKLGVLHHIGYEGRRELYETQLQGQVIDLRKYPYDKRGKRTVSYSIGRRASSVKIAAYPLNLYKPQQVYSSAAAIVQSRIERSLEGYDERILQGRIDKLDKEARA